jgi:hypothetical protein
MPWAQLAAQVPLRSNVLPSITIVLPATDAARIPFSLSTKRACRTVRFLPSARMPAPF